MHHRNFTPALLATMAFPIAALVYAALLTLFEHDLTSAAGWLRTAVPALATLLLVGTVLAAVHHAEVIAARLREPLGTLVLTLSVTLIEVSIVVSMMFHAGDNPTLAREAVFSVVMIVCTGVVGLCLLVGGLRHYEQEFQIRGTSAFLAVLTALVVLVLVLPDYTTGATGYFSGIQLLFVGGASILLYGAFLFIQTVRHREDFLSIGAAEVALDHPRPSAHEAAVSLAWLLAGLLGVVLLAEHVAAGIEDGLRETNLPQPDAIVGALVALLVLLPESIAAVRAAARNDLQTSLNIALGSALATIGLTIPAVAAIAVFTGRNLVFGLDPHDMVLVILALTLSIISFGTGRTNLLTGLVHLVVFGAYVLLLFEP